MLFQRPLDRSLNEGRERKQCGFLWAELPRQKGPGTGWRLVCAKNSKKATAAGVA